MKVKLKSETETTSRTRTPPPIDTFRLYRLSRSVQSLSLYFESLTDESVSIATDTTLRKFRRNNTGQNLSQEKSNIKSVRFSNSEPSPPSTSSKYFPIRNNQKHEEEVGNFANQMMTASRDEEVKREVATSRFKNTSDDIEYLGSDRIPKRPQGTFNRVSGYRGNHDLPSRRAQQHRSTSPRLRRSNFNKYSLNRNSIKNNDFHDKEKPIDFETNNPIRKVFGRDRSNDIAHHGRDVISHGGVPNNARGTKQRLESGGSPSRARWREVINDGKPRKVYGRKKLESGGKEIQKVTDVKVEKSSRKVCQDVGNISDNTSKNIENIPVGMTRKNEKSSGKQKNPPPAVVKSQKKNKMWDYFKFYTPF